MNGWSRRRVSTCTSERATGRTVIGFMSGNRQHPAVMCEVFTLVPTEEGAGPGTGTVSP